MRGWVLPLVLAGCGLVLAALRLADGSPVVAAVLFVAFGALAVLLSPWAFPAPVTDAEARRRGADDGRPIVYWRPGCRYCLRLRFRLGRDARRAHWVNIWRDPDGAAAVRAATGGDETVPTVALAGETHVNPDPAWLRQRLP